MENPVLGATKIAVFAGVGNEDVVSERFGVFRLACGAGVGSVAELLHFFTYAYFMPTDETDETVVAPETSAAEPAEPAATAALAPVVEKKPNLLKRLYSWVLHWADTPYGLPALCVLAFVESSFFPIPPDVLLIALCIGAPRKAFKFVFWAALFSVLGGVLGYYIGYAFYEEVGKRIIDFFHYQEQFDKVKALYGEYGFLAIVTAGFTPIPYKVFTIAAGVCHDTVSLLTLVSASIVGRTGRFALVGAAIFYLGPKIKPLLDKYLEWFCLAFMVLLIGSFVVLKYLL
jgi:membrane protein YqaA with SNARE-associated domain